MPTELSWRAHGLVGTVCQVQQASGLLGPAAEAEALADPCGTCAALGHQSSRPAGEGEGGVLRSVLQLSHTGLRGQASLRGRPAAEQSVLQPCQIVAGVPRRQALGQGATAVEYPALPSCPTWWPHRQARGQVLPAAGQPALPSCPTWWPQRQARGQGRPAAEYPAVGPCLLRGPLPPPRPCLPSGVHGLAACRCGPTEPPLRRWSQPGACSMQTKHHCAPQGPGYWLLCLLHVDIRMAHCGAAFR